MHSILYINYLYGEEINERPPVDDNYTVGGGNARK